MSKVFSFQKQLNIGNVGETLFLRFYKNLNPSKSEDRTYDFNLGDGTTVEVKVDTYDSPNFFMERYGNIEKMTDGGVFRAAKDGVTHFVYLFINEMTFYWFDSAQLVNFLNKNLDNYQSRNIANRTWTTFGYLVPRVDIESLALKKDIFNV